MGDQILLYTCQQPITEQHCEYIAGLLDDDRATVDATSATGSTPLFELVRHHAVACNEDGPERDLFLLLLRKNADPNAIDACTGLCLLQKGGVLHNPGCCGRAVYGTCTSRYRLPFTFSES